jgi:hypothetical protein
MHCTGQYIIHENIGNVGEVYGGSEVFNGRALEDDPGSFRNIYLTRRDFSIYNFGITRFREEICRTGRRPIFNIRVGGREIEDSPKTRSTCFSSKHSKISDPLYVATKFPPQTLPQCPQTAANDEAEFCRIRSR